MKLTGFKLLISANYKNGNIKSSRFINLELDAVREAIIYFG